MLLARLFEKNIDLIKVRVGAKPNDLQCLVRVCKASPRLRFNWKGISPINVLPGSESARKFWILILIPQIVLASAYESIAPVISVFNPPSGKDCAASFNLAFAWIRSRPYS